MNTSRTYKTIQNTRISLIFFIIQILLGFYSRKIFLDFLGTEILGLNTTLSNVLGFINLAEMGIGVAMASSLYEPIWSNDKRRISEILSVQSILYRRIAYLFLIVSVPLLCLFPVFFKNISVPLIYVYVAYFVFLWGTISGYLWNYKEILIGADQKNYKLMPYIQIGRMVKTIIQIILLIYGGLGCWGWLAVEFIFSTLIIFIINIVINREYPWLKISRKNSKEQLENNRTLIKQTKQLFFHKISAYILYESTPIIIYVYVSLSMVTYYGNYMILIGYTISLMNAVFEGMGASIGNLVAENNKSHIIEVFWELFTARFWFASLCCFAIYIFLPHFIILWIGEEYLLDNTTLILIVLCMFIRISRSVIDSFKNAYKLFDDIMAPVIEAILNLSLSLLLGYYWGLDGILVGINISLILVVLIWKPYYVYKKGFIMPIYDYIKKYIIHLLIIVGTILVCTQIMKSGNLVRCDSYISLIIYTLVNSLIFGAISFVLLYLFTSGMRMFFYRVLRMLYLK